LAALIHIAKFNGFALRALFNICLAFSYVYNFAKPIHKSIYFGKHYTALYNKFLAYYIFDS